MMLATAVREPVAGDAAEEAAQLRRDPQQRKAAAIEKFAAAQSELLQKIAAQVEIIDPAKVAELLVESEGKPVHVKLACSYMDMHDSNISRDQEPSTKNATAEAFICGITPLSLSHFCDQLSANETYAGTTERLSGEGIYVTLQLLPNARDLGLQDNRVNYWEEQQAGYYPASTDLMLSFSLDPIAKPLLTNEAVRAEANKEIPEHRRHSDERIVQDIRKISVTPEPEIIAQEPVAEEPSAPEPQTSAATGGPAKHWLRRIITLDF